MKYSRLMKERIHRVKVLFKELGFEIYDGVFMEGAFSGGFETSGTFAGAFFIDSTNKFLELAFSFSFSSSLGAFLQSRLKEMVKICYEFGCYTNIDGGENLSFSVFSKIYFAGLNYYSLKETLKDFRGCVNALKEVIEITQNTDGEETSP